MMEGKVVSVADTMDRFSNGYILIDMRNIADYHTLDEALSIAGELLNNYFFGGTWNNMSIDDYIQSRFGAHKEVDYDYLKVTGNGKLSSTKGGSLTSKYLVDMRDLIERYLAEKSTYSSAEANFDSVFDM